MNPHRSGSAQEYPDANWDAIFTDSDPTRVLEPFPTAPDEEPPVSAVRHRRVPANRVVGATEQEEGRAADPGQGNHAGLRSAGLRSAGASSPYHRIQFIPAFLGAVIAHGLVSGLLQLAELASGLLGFQSYDFPTQAVLALITPASGQQALPWSIILLVIYVLSFAAAGYGAARMSAIAPVKQAAGIFLVTLLSVLLASLLYWGSAALGYPLTPRFSGQSFLAGDFSVGLLTLLTVLGLVFISSLLGALVGSTYQQRLKSSFTRS